MTMATESYRHKTHEAALVRGLQIAHFTICILFPTLTTPILPCLTVSSSSLSISISHVVWTLLCFHFMLCSDDDFHNRKVFTVYIFEFSLYNEPFYLPALFDLNVRTNSKIQIGKQPNST